MEKENIKKSGRKTKSDLTDLLWCDTTLRKGTNTPKICRDMFVCNSMGKLELIVVKNGRVRDRQLLNIMQANEIINNNNLKNVPSDTFNNCSSWRTAKSNDLIEEILSKVRIN